MKDKYTIKTYNTDCDFQATFTNDNINTCFAEFISYTPAQPNAIAVFYNIMYSLQDMANNCANYITKLRIEEAYKVIKALAPRVNNKDATEDSLEMKFIMQDYVLELVKHLPDNLILILCNNLVAVYGVEFTVKNTGE